MNVTVVGLGKLGAPLAAVLADAGHRVRGVDLSQKYVDAINDSRAPVDEPGLSKLIVGLDPDLLQASTDYAWGMEDSDMSLVIVPTPSGDDGRFSNEFVLDAVREISKNIPQDRYHTVVICSTVMPGSTGGIIKDELARVSGHRLGKTSKLSAVQNEIGLLYSPEFIALGSVIDDMLDPDMVLVGGEDQKAFDAFRDLVESYLGKILSSYEVGAAYVPLRCMGYTEAELAKISINTYITMKISYANTIGALAEPLGVDADKVLKAVGTDSRIGTKYLRSGAAYGGPCFPRDTVAFGALGEQLSVPTPLAAATDEVNEQVISSILLKLVDHHDVAILGMAYKPGTTVTEESMGRKLLVALRAEGVRVVTHDPVAESVYADAQRCIDHSTAVVIATPYPEYAKQIYCGKLVIDPWGVCK